MPAYGSSCVSQVRRCNNGVLSGSYQYSTCAVQGPLSCLFNGQTIAHGGNVQAYQNSSVAFGESCSAETRTCNNGALSGSNVFASCNVAGPASCLFNGQTVAHGSAVPAFSNSTVAFGQSCSSEQRLCNNGVLSGSNQYASCEVDAAASCLFNGQTIAHGQNVQAFPNSSVGYGQTCVAEQRSCNNGVLSGSSAYASCNVDAPAACLFNGQTVAHGSAVPAFSSSSVGYGQSCVAEARTCENGVLSGSNTFASCSVEAPQACLFNGQTVAHGSSVPAFQNSTQAYGSQCVSEQRSCENGVMSGSYQYGSCNVDAAASCLFNGQTVAHGQSVQAFPSSSVAFGDMCISDARTCDNGILSGANQFASCAVDRPAACLFNGQTVAHGSSIQAFGTSTVGFGESCVAEERGCYNGVLDGSSQYASCTVAQPASCLINGLTIAHGQSTILFKDKSVAHGQTCESQSRVCSNGTLSGSYSEGSCVVEEAKTCSFNGQTIANGSSVKAYASSTVPFGSTCQSETRTCTNGQLSGSNTVASCTVLPKPPVNPPKSCTFNGKSVAHGSSVQAFKSSSVGYGQKCESETRTCNDGVLSGKNTASSCADDGPKSCKILFGLITIPHGFTLFAATNSSAGAGSRCEAEITLCNNGQFVIDPSLTCQSGTKPPVTIPPPKPGETQCELDPKSNNGKHIGVDHDGKHVDFGAHLGWYKGDKPCKDPKPPVTPVPPKEDPKKPCNHKKDEPKKEEPKKKPCDHNDKHKSSKDKDDCDKKRKK